MKTLFTSKAWQGDYRRLLAGGFDRKHSLCKYPFDERWLLLNNIDDELDKKTVKELTGADLVVWAADHADEALDFFGLKKKDLGKAYYYSICELVELYLAKDFDYLCHFASDTLLSKPYDWITPSIKLMETDPTIITTSPNSEDSMAYGMKNQFFSDQAYIIKVDEWRKPGVFSYLFPDLNEFPSYGGDALFERRAARYLNNHGKYRQLLKEVWLHHNAW